MDTKYIIIIEFVIIIILVYINKVMPRKTSNTLTKKRNGATPKIKHGKLNNGMKYILNNTKCGDKSTIMLFVKVGSRDESRELNGMSHVLEHMLFQGTSKYPSSQELHEAIDRYGAVFNAYTSLDITCYYISIHPDYINVALDILSDLYFNSLLLDKHLEKEKTVVYNEIKKNNSKPTRVLQQEIISSIMNDTTMKYPIAGSEKKVSTFTREDLLMFLNFYYNPNKVLLSIGGNVDNLNALLKEVKLKFDINKTYPSDKKIKHKRVLYPNFYDFKCKSKIHYIKKSIDTSYVTIGFPSYKLNSNDSYILDLIGTLMSKYMSSRLFKRLRNELGIIYSINFNVDTLEDCGYCYFMCGTHDVEKCVPVILEELNRLKTTLVDESELQRAKDNINGSMKMGMNDSEVLATHYGIHYLYYGKIVSIEESINRLNNVTPEDIKRVANLTFKHDKLKLFYMGKKKYNLKNTLTP